MSRVGGEAMRSAAALITAFVAEDRLAVEEIVGSERAPLHLAVAVAVFASALVETISESYDEPALEVWQQLLAVVAARMEAQ